MMIDELISYKDVVLERAVKTSRNSLLTQEAKAEEQLPSDHLL